MRPAPSRHMQALHSPDACMHNTGPAPGWWRHLQMAGRLMTLCMAGQLRETKGALQCGPAPPACDLMFHDHPPIRACSNAALPIVYLHAAALLCRDSTINPAPWSLHLGSFKVLLQRPLTDPFRGDGLLEIAGTAEP